MRPRPDWLRVVEGGAGSSVPGKPPSARPTMRRSGAHRCATPLPLPGRALDVEEHASFRWNASPWVKWMPAVLACSVLSGAMLWNLGRLWLERADSTAFAWRPTSITITDATPAKPATKAPSVKAPPGKEPSESVRDAAKEAARRPGKRLPAQPAPVKDEPADMLGLLAAASLLASLPPAQASPAAPPVPPTTASAAPEPDRTREQRPAARAPVARHENMVHAITVRDEAFAAAGIEDIKVHIEGLPEDVKRAIMDSVRREVRAWCLDARRTAFPPGGPTAGLDPTGARFADEHRITVYDDGGLRIGLQKLTAPATPKG